MELKDKILEQFEKIAHELSATWKVTETFSEITKNNFTVRVIWQLERDSGVFVTVAHVGDDDREYGLPYLVEFLTGDARDLAAAISKEPETTAAVTRKYVSALFDDPTFDYSGFVNFAEARIRGGVSQMMAWYPWLQPPPAKNEPSRS
jgi:hypothetical protein